jgi:hypothetical protein
LNIQRQNFPRLAFRAYFEGTTAYFAIRGEPLRRNARIDNQLEIEGLFYQADSKVNALRALVWRFGATGEAKLAQTIGHNKTQLAMLLKQTRDKSNEKKLHELVREHVAWALQQGAQGAAKRQIIHVSGLRDPRDSAWDQRDG